MNVICCGACVCVGSREAGWDVGGLVGSMYFLYLYPSVSYRAFYFRLCSSRCSVLHLPSSRMLVKPSGIGPVF